MNVIIFFPLTRRALENMSLFIAEKSVFINYKNNVSKILSKPLSVQMLLNLKLLELKIEIIRTVNIKFLLPNRNILTLTVIKKPLKTLTFLLKFAF